MNNVRTCPMCYGQGKILITDYIDHIVLHDRPIPCPVCIGIGILRRYEAAFGV